MRALEYPNIVTGQGHTSVEAIVQLKSGIWAGPANLFVGEVNKYGRQVVFEKDGEQADGRAIIEIMMLTAGHGSKVKIIIEGEDYLARELAVRLYSGMTSEDDTRPSLNRFSTPEPDELEGLVQGKFGIQ